MAKLDPLIRVRKHTVEQKQKFLAELFRQAEDLEAQKANLLAKLEEERLALEGMETIDAVVSFGHYSKAVTDRVDDIDAERKKLEPRIQRAQDDIREAFSDLKKIEIINKRREEEERTAADKKESQELDEIALETHRRNEKKM